MPNVNPTRYQLDLTGTSQNNIVVGEVHTPPMKMIRSIAPIYGPYFTESVQVYDSSNGATLIRGTHYQCVDIIGLPTAQTGKEICAIILLTDKTVPGARLTYQSLGGQYEKDHAAIRLLMENITNDSRYVSWENVLNKPEGFNPTLHLHKLGDAIGYEYAVAALEQLKNAILLGDDTLHADMFVRIKAIENALTTNRTIVNLTAELNALTVIVNNGITLANAIDAKCNTTLVRSQQILDALA